MSMSSSNTKLTEDAGELERYLKLTEKCRKRAQQMTGAPSLSTSPKFNFEQCKYLADKLKLAVESAHSFLVLLKREYVWFSSPEGMAKCLESFKLLYALSKEVESFTQDCCNDAWILAALTLINVSEHISSVGFDLELRRSVFSESNLRARRSLTLTEVDTVFKTEVETVKEKTTLDTKTLSSKLHAVLLSTKSRSPEHQLAAFVLDRLHKRLVPAGEFSGSSQSSLSGTVLKSLKQKAVQQLGQSSEAIVYKVAWMGAEVAVKTFYGQDNTNFIKEVSVLRELFHPNIISFLGFAKDNRKRCIVMEKMDGNLHSLMQTRVGENESPFGILEGVDIMLQIGGGVHYLHESRIAHRDLKSWNILVRSVTSSESEIDYVRAKVADFGVSKTNLKSITNTIQTYNTGTPRWTAPELIKLSGSESTKEKLEGEAMVEKYPLKCDMYSFAMVCYEILTGEYPFSNIPSNTEVKKLVLKGDRPHLPEGCPDELKRLIERCWSQDPSTRPSFGDVCAELRHLKCLLLTPSVAMVDNSIGASSMTMAAYSNINYLKESISSIDAVQKLSKDQKVQLNPRQCEYLFDKLTETGCFLRAKSESLISIRPLKKSPAPAPEPPVPSESLREELKESSGRTIWWNIRSIAFNLVRKRDLDLQTRPSLKRGFSRASEVSASRSQPEEKPLGYLVNQMGPPNLDNSNSKLDVIFFEGNVGRRKDISCKDTWVQRNKPNVWWPRDWLPMDLGGDSRVLLLEYSISDDGVEGVLDQLQRLLVFSDRWNRRHTWERPIVLVGHSLGCVMIEHLVVALDRRARSLETVEDGVEIGRARVAQAFLTSLAGCFFYAPPWTGLVPSEDLLKHVFGGLSYSRELFSDLCLDSPKLKLLSEDFMRAQRKHMKLTALIEGSHTRGRTVVPPASMQNFSCTCMELLDSSHTDVCKPTDKQHPAYKELLDFVREILEN